jgi:metallothionein
MPRYKAGTVMTCAHEACACRVVIVDECHCPGTETEGQTYMCACGTPLLPVEETVAADAGSR